MGQVTWEQNHDGHGHKWMHDLQKLKMVQHHQYSTHSATATPEILVGCLIASPTLPRKPRPLRTKSLATNRQQCILPQRPPECAYLANSARPEAFTTTC